MCVWVCGAQSSVAGCARLYSFFFLRLIILILDVFSLSLSLFVWSVLVPISALSSRSSVSGARVLILWDPLARPERSLLQARAHVKHLANLSLYLFITASSVQDPTCPVPNLHVLVEYRDIFGEKGVKEVRMVRGGKFAEAMETAVDRLVNAHQRSSGIDRVIEMIVNTISRSL